MANRFEQFDQEPAPSTPTTANRFEQFDEPTGDTFADRFAGERPRPPVQMLEHGISTTPLPQPFIDRVERGIKEGWGDAPMGEDPSPLHRFYQEQAERHPTPLTLFNAGVSDVTSTVLETISRGFSAAVHGAQEGASELFGEKFGRETGAMLEWALQRGDINLARPHLGPDGVIRNQVIGTLPKDADFATGATVLNSAQAETNLRTLYEERGILPAEAVHDAQNNAFLKQEIAPPSFVAFHGSPHEFEAFDISKIGTGEAGLSPDLPPEARAGRGSYGHGLYFAENEEVAREYRKNLSKDTLLIDGKPPEPEDLDPNIARDLLVAAKAKPGQEITVTRDLVEKYYREYRNSEPSLTGLDFVGHRISSPDTGVVYQVRIHADQEHFLDWDKPLSEQSEFIKNAIRPLVRERTIETGHATDYILQTGGDLHSSLKEFLGDNEKVSQRLSQVGIPGIKYLDQGSRGAIAPQTILQSNRSGQWYVADASGKNLHGPFEQLAEAKSKKAEVDAQMTADYEAKNKTRNFVIFDHNAIEITHKNGVALEPTKVPPVVGSPMPEGTPRTELARTGDPLMDRILNHPTVQRVINNPVVDDTHTILNSWGGSVPFEDPTLFRDKAFPKSMTVDGVTFNTADPATIHENVEAFVINALTRARRQSEVPEALSGEMTVDRARQRASMATEVEESRQDQILGSKELGDKYRNILRRMMYQDDDVSSRARSQMNEFTKDLSQKQIAELEKDLPENQSPEWWRSVADTISQHTSINGKQDLGSNMAHALEDFPDHQNWERMSEQEKLAVVAVKTVMEDAARLGVDNDQLFKSAVSAMRHRYGEDAEFMAQRALDAATSMRGGGWSPAKALKVGFWEFGEKAEDAFYRAHGIDPEHAEAALAPFVDQIAARKFTGPLHSQIARRPGDQAAYRQGHIDEIAGKDAEYTGDSKFQYAYDRGRNDARAAKRLPPGSEPMGFPGQFKMPIGKEGYIEFNVSDEAVKVHFPFIGEEERGKGLGIAAYQKLADWAIANGKELRSGGDVSPSAVKMYDALERRGYTVDRSAVAEVTHTGALRVNPPGIRVTGGPSSDIPSNLFRDTYPGSDPRKAAPGPIDKPTAAEIAEAREIIARHLDDEAALSPAGADVTRPENLPTLAEQPPLPRGLIVAEARQAIDQAFGLVEHVKLLFNPMVTGSNRAIVIAKKAISAVRRIHFEHFQQDAEIMRRWPDPEDRKLMWEAGDEESVLRQEGMQESGAAEHMGWNRLPDDMRRFMEWLDGESQTAWMNSIDAGLVKGEGLPAYMTRMLLNMATVGAESPHALNELGRNVFTRTAQMLHRGNLMAEETEGAAKALVRTRMEKAGATPEAIEKAVSQVQIARDIRALPLAIRRMKEAAIWKNMIDNIDQIGKATGRELVFDSPGPGRFTIEGNPAFTEWRPDYALNPVTGKMEARVDDAGKVIFKPSPKYMDNEFKGPMLSILDEGTSKGVLVQGTQSVYGAIMSLKGKAMTAILNSPLIHNEVVWGKVVEAMGGREWLGIGAYVRGYQMQVANPGRAGQLVESGLFPIGHRGPIQDINAIMTEPTLTPGRSITAKVLGAVPGLFDAGAELTVRRKIDQMGDFWHNTLLWDRVRDVQFGLADHLSDRFVAKGLDRYTADVVASHMANMVVGSIPKEAMSGFARASANMLLFSRSFTLGNWAMIKQAMVGLPKPIVALIEDHAAQQMELRRNVDGSFGPDSMPAEEMLQIATKTAKSMGRWKAVSMLGFSIVLMEGVNAALQHAFNIMQFDNTLDDEIQGYARRYHQMMEEGPQVWPPVTGILSQLSPTHDNEPGHQDRVHIGFDKDGRAQYGRSPVGKYGEEIQGILTMPMNMVKRKLNPVGGPRPFLEWMMNDKSLGDWEKPDRIYDPHEAGVWGNIKAAFAVAENFLANAMPKQQINAATDLLRGEGDDTTNKFRLYGPAAGFTTSVGAPGGMKKGEFYASKNRQETQFDMAWPDIRRQIQRGDEQGARQVMDALHLTPREQDFRIRSVQMPGNIGSRALRNFYQHATPTEVERFLNAPQAPQ